MALRPRSSEMLISLNEDIYLYEMELETLDRYRIRLLNGYHQLREAKERDEQEIQHASEQLIVYIDELFEETHRVQNDYEVLNERRNRLFIELNKSTYELLEERRPHQPGINPESTENVIQQLFSPNVDDRTRVTVKHLVFYCMHKNNYITTNPCQSIYGLLKDFWNPTKGIGEGVLLMGYRYREKFRSYLDEHYPHRRFLSLAFIEFLSASLTHMYLEHYMPGNTHLTFLIVVSFAMEVIYYLRECPHVYRRQIIKFTVYKLSCLLSSPEFINTCGLDKLEMYGVIVHKGHMLDPPFDYLRSPLYQSWHPANIPWDYLERYPQTDFDESPELPTSRSIQMLEALPAGTEAGNIVSSLRVSQYRFEKSNSGTSTSESGTVAHESGSSSLVSRLTTQEPGTSTQEPRTSTQEPRTSAQEHGSSAQKSEISAQEFETSAQKSVTSAQESETSAQEDETAL